MKLAQWHGFWQRFAQTIYLSALPQGSHIVIWQTASRCLTPPVFPILAEWQISRGYMARFFDKICKAFFAANKTYP